MTPAEQTLYVNTDTGEVRSEIGGDTVDLVLRLLTETRISLAFHNAAGTVAALEAASTGWIVIKAQNQATGTRLFNDLDWEKSGAGTATRYLFNGLLDSADLRSGLAKLKSKTFTLQIGWKQPSDANNSASEMFDVSIGNNQIRDGDIEADPAISSRVVPIKHMLDVTGLTGGGDTNLDGALDITSADENRLFALVIGGVYQLWRVEESTAAEDASAGIVRPDNYDGTTNPYLYVQIQ